MLAILNALNAHNFPKFLPILMILVSKIMVHRALSDKTYFLLGLLSPLNWFNGANLILKVAFKMIKGNNLKHIQARFANITPYMFFSCCFTIQ